jgi:DNA-binding response OmpR family regulator
MSYDFGNLRVLILEDNKPMLEIIRAILFSFGVGEAYGVSNGEQGYDLFCEYEPDLVIADWMMSPGDGLSFTRKVRTSKDSPNPFVPIILITGFSSKKRVMSARDTGITEFLVKPFTAKDLYSRMVQIIERPRKYIRSDVFFGPDRRRSNKMSDYNGSRRRASDDEQSNNTVNLDIKKR